MSIEKRAKEALKVIKGQIEQLVGIIGRDGRYCSYEVTIERIHRWRDRTARLLAEKVHRAEANKFDQLAAYSGAVELDEILQTYRPFLEVLAEHLQKHPEDVFSPQMPADEEASRRATPGSRIVFIIHGHDKANLLMLEKMLKEHWNLEPVVMRWRAEKGRTLIEKFEDEASAACFAFALMTPDDWVKTVTGEYAQARPNVVFELGWFCGRLGRQNLCILMKKGTQIHSDLEGIGRIEFVESVEEGFTQIERELEAANLVKRA